VTFLFFDLLMFRS